jgi:hypothetical protein
MITGARKRVPYARQNWGNRASLSRPDPARYDGMSEETAEFPDCLSNRNENASGLDGRISHVTAILKAMEVSNRTEAVIAVSELGWELPPVAKS